MERFCVQLTLLVKCYDKRNISHYEGLTSLLRLLKLRDNKQTSSDTLIELTEIVPENNISEFDKKKSVIRGTDIGTSFHLRMLFHLRWT